MESKSSTKRNVTTTQAIKILADSGLEVSEKEAEDILDFLYFLGKLTVGQILKNDLDVNADQPLPRGKSFKKRNKVKSL